MNKKGAFANKAKNILGTKPTSMADLLSDEPAQEQQKKTKSATARTVRKDGQSGETGVKARAGNADKSKKAARLSRAEKPVRKEVSITSELEQKLKTARIALRMYENDIFNEALADYLQRREKEIKTALKEQLGI